MKCNICGSEITLKKKYNDHVPTVSFKALVKQLLPYFDCIIPGCIPKLKRHSSNTSPFKGTICICGNCGYGVMENPPTEHELQCYYHNDYWSKRSSSVATAIGAHNDYRNNPRAIHQVDLALKHINGATISNILEIGAGNAYASLLLKHRRNDSITNLHVCEPGMQWEEYYKKHGIKRIANFFPFDTDKRFDYVHTSHWLEHVRDLDVTLLALRTIVHHTGYVFVEVPNTEHFYWDLPNSDVPHIHFFTTRSLVTVFKNYNFECLTIGEYGITFLEHQKGGRVTPDRCGGCEKGFLIRGLFKKTA